VDPATVHVYETRAAEWRERRPPVATEARRARRFGRSVAPGAVRVDLGAGYGPYTEDLGEPVVALDAADAMVRAVAERAVPGRLAVVRASLEAPPFRPGSLGGAWANKSYLHVPRLHLPLALARLHRALRVGAPLELSVLAGDHEGSDLPDDDFPGRFFACWQPAALARVVEGAGFADVTTTVRRGWLVVRAARARTLPDFVGPDLRILVCGLNPSVYSADRGVGFARPGNRFWPAALAAGLVDRPRDAERALAVHRVGMTDLVKRATPRADDLAPAEYPAGIERVRDLVSWLRPAVLCVVGLTGWRAAVDRSAVAGPQPGGLAGTPVYLMPNPSGLNAHMDVPRLADHLRAAVAHGEGSAVRARRAEPPRGGSSSEADSGGHT
jgi:TDG/mug DNA glycosylase family protein